MQADFAVELTLPLFFNVLIGSNFMRLPWIRVVLEVSHKASTDGQSIFVSEYLAVWLNETPPSMKKFKIVGIFAAGKKSNFPGEYNIEIKASKS